MKSLVKAMAVAFGGAAFSIMLTAGDGAHAASRPTVAEFMAKMGWSPDEIDKVVKGQIATRKLATKMVGPNDTAEVAVLGVVRVDVTRQAFIDAVEHPTNFGSVHHLASGVIQDPPQASDFAAMSLPPGDIKDLKDCQPGNCALRLAGASIADLQSKVDWKSKDPAEQVNRVAREKLLAFATDYMKQGLAAIKPFVDAKTAVNIDEQFRQLLADTPMLIASYPELATYLKDYPGPKLASSKDVIYWSLEDFGLKPTLMVTQAVRYVPEGTDDVMVVKKQVYASHFFNAGLSTTTYAKEAEGSYIVELNRVRADGLGGAFGGTKRGKMEGSMEDALKKLLQDEKSKLQTSAGKTP